MKHGINLYVRAASHLFSNIRAVLWATGPAWVLLTIVTSFAAYLIVGETDEILAGTDADAAFVLPPYFWTYFMVSQCLNFMTLGYIGPKFHRATLPDDSRALPFPYSDYLFGLMKVGLVGIGLGFVASRLVSVISNTLPGPLAELTFPVLFILGILYVMLRFSVFLPAISLCRSMSMHQAWAMTKPNRYALFASLVLLVLTIAGLHSLALIWKGVPWASLIFGTIASWFALMFLLSYLNIIYRETRRHQLRMAQAT